MKLFITSGIPAVVSMFGSVVTFPEWSTDRILANAFAVFVFTALISIYDEVSR